MVPEKFAVRLASEERDQLEHLARAGRLPKDGAAALAHGNRGRRPHNAIAPINFAGTISSCGARLTDPVDTSNAIQISNRVQRQQTRVGLIPADYTRRIDARISPRMGSDLGETLSSEKLRHAVNVFGGFGSRFEMQALSFPIVG